MSRAGTKWTPEEESQLVSGLASGSLGSVASAHGRSVKAIVLHLEEMAARALDMGYQKEQVAQAYKLPECIILAIEVRKQLVGDERTPNTRFGEKWTDQEEAQLYQAIQTYPLIQIAQSLGRSTKAIIMHLEEMAVRALDKKCTKEAISAGYKLPMVIVEACDLRRQICAQAGPSGMPGFSNEIPIEI